MNKCESKEYKGKMELCYSCLWQIISPKTRVEYKNPCVWNKDKEVALVNKESK